MLFTVIPGDRRPGIACNVVFDNSALSSKPANNSAAASAGNGQYGITFFQNEKGAPLHGRMDELLYNRPETLPACRWEHGQSAFTMILEKCF
jgi:hypothetical protein